MKEAIQQLAKGLLQEVTDWRRYLHAHPELSFQEVETARFIAGQLQSTGVEFRQGIAGNGIAALIKGRNPRKRTVALRADMDALPIQEANETPWASRNPGVMHACGHDVHTASLLGAVKILHSLRDSFEGTVKCIFQPGRNCCQAEPV